MSVATVLLYNLGDDTDRGRAVRKLCALQKLRVRGVLPAEQGKTLAALLTGDPTPVPAPDVPFSEPMLVMAYLTPAQQNRLLRGLRSLPPITLKALLTPTNAAWSSVALQQELRREHEARLENRD